MTENSTNEDDFWWIPRLNAASELLVGVAHLEAQRDDDYGLLQMSRSIDAKGRASTLASLHPLPFLQEWRSIWKDENVFRTYELFDSDGQPVLIGPFYLDIDNENGDLDDALSVTRDCIALLRSEGVASLDLRVLFTGHKGFNVEVRPEAVGLNSTDMSKLGSWREKTAEIILALRTQRAITGGNINTVSARGTVIDHILSQSPHFPIKHKYLRLVGSKNTWIDMANEKRWRIKVEVDVAKPFASPAASFYKARIPQ